MEHRLDYPDYIRGLMILWVIFVHISLNANIISFGIPFDKYSIYSWMSFYMIPFYFFSGSFLNINKSFKDFLWSKEKGLVFPYIFFTILSILVYEIYLLIVESRIDTNLIFTVFPSGQISSNLPMWFLISLFLVNIIYYLLKRFLNIHCIWIVSLLCLVYSWMTNSSTHVQFLMHRTVILGLFFFHLGFEYKQNIHFINSNSSFFFITSLLLYFGIGLFDQQSFWFVQNLQGQGHYILGIVYSLSATYLCIYFSKKIPQNTNIKFIDISLKFVKYLGANSLVFYGTHRFLLNYIIEPVYRVFDPSIENKFQFVLITFIFILFICSILNKIILRYFPAVIGK